MYLVINRGRGVEGKRVDGWIWVTVLKSGKVPNLVYHVLIEPLHLNIF